MREALKRFSLLPAVELSRHLSGDSTEVLISLEFVSGMCSSPAASLSGVDSGGVGFIAAHSVRRLGYCIMTFVMFELTKFSILSAFRRKGVSFLAILGVGLGSALLVVLLSFSEGIEAMFDQTFQQVSGTISVISKGSNVLGRMMGTTGDPLPKSYIGKIRKLEGVEKVASYVAAQIPMTAFKAPNFMGIGLTGIGDDDGELFGYPNRNIVEGRPFEKEREVIAGSPMIADAKILKQEIKIGDKFKVPIGKTGESIELTIVGFFGTGNAVSDYGFVGRESLARKITQLSKKKVSGIMVQAKDASRAKEIASQVEALFKKEDPEVSAVLPTDILERLNTFLGIFRSFLLVIALVAAVAGGMAVMVVMLLTGFERRREFGVLKASGWSNGSVVISVLLTSLTLALLGALAGLGLGAGAALGLSWWVGDSPIGGTGQLAVFTWEVFAWAFGVGLVTGVLGGIIPAVSAVWVSPIEALRSE